MNTPTQYDPITGEIAKAETEDTPLAVKLAQVELDQAISTAKAYPRSLAAAKARTTQLVMLDEETAEECVYALPRGGKPIKGPSVRFAEIVASQYGNCHVGSRVVEVNKFEKYVEAEGVFHDLESGLRRTARIRRRISGRNGQVYNDDMIVVTGNAACAIAMREAVLKGIPKAVWREAYAAAEHVIAGDVKTLAERREKLMKAFAAFGVTPDQIFASLEVEGMDDITLDHLGTLRATYAAIKDGEQTVESYFPTKTDKQEAVKAAKGTAAKMQKLAEGETKGDEPEEKPKEEPKQAESEAESDEKPSEDGEAQKEAESSSQGEKQSDEGNVSEAEAYQRGVKAGRRGMKADALPKEFVGNDALTEAWKDGRIEGEAEREAE